MALQVKFDVQEGSDGTEMIITETTGNYSSLNLTGYGAPNRELSSIEEIILSIYPPDWTVPIMVKIEVANLVVTGMSIKQPSDVAYVAIDETDWPITYIPFDEGNEMVFTPSLLGLSGEVFEDFDWLIEMEVNGTEGSAAYSCTSSFKALFYEQTECCIESAYLDLDPCGCNKDKAINTLLAEAWLKAAILSAEAGEATKAKANLKKAKELCEGSCKTC